MSGSETYRDRCPSCGDAGETNGRGIAYVCQNQSCRVTAFTMQAVSAE